MDTPLEGWTIMDTPLEGWTIMDTPLESCVLCVHASIYIDQCYCMTEVTRAEECTQDMFIVGVGYA